MALEREIQVVKFIHLFSFYSELPAYYFPTTNSNIVYKNALILLLKKVN